MRDVFTARLRVRVNHGGHGKLGLGYILNQPNDIIDSAFQAEVDKVAAHLADKPVIRGTAPDPVRG